MSSLHKKIKFPIKNFFSKCDQIRKKLRIWSHLLKKYLMENLIFCAMHPMLYQDFVWRSFNFTACSKPVYQGGWCKPSTLSFAYNPVCLVQKKQVYFQIWSKFTGEHPCRSAISIKLQSNFIETTIRHGCSPVNALYIFRTPFLKNTSAGLLLQIPQYFRISR